VDTPVAFWDVLPTVAEVVGGKPPAGDGQSLLPLLQAKAHAAAPERSLYWEAPRKDGLAQAIRRGHWKAVREAGAEWELYDLAQDPSEKRDLASAQPSRSREMASLARACHRPSQDFISASAAEKKGKA
jgi:arylsulfatase A